MSLQPASFTCDVCGKRRDNDVNHWWMLMTAVEGIAIRHWSKSADEYDAHACGQACAVVLLTRWMEAGDFTDGVKGTKSETLNTRG